MSLVHPIIEPQMAVRACKGWFFGSSQEWVALLYSNRIVFTPVKTMLGAGPRIDKAANEEDDADADSIVISIPQPPMTLGDTEQEILPNLGGAFFSIGRNRDMLAIQYSSALVVLSINSVTQTLELQGIWGLPKLKDASTKLSSHTKALHSRVPSASSLVALAEQASISGGAGSPKQPSSSSTAAAGRSGLMISPQLPPPKPSPDGTQIFVATRNKYGTPVLIILSAYGKEVLRVDVDYLDIMTLGWISDELIYFVYMNNKFHKKFQVCRLTHKTKSTGLFGMGRKLVKPSMLFEVNIPIALDFQPSVTDIMAGPDLVFKDCVMLGTRDGGYLRVNHRAGAWEPVLNAKNVAGVVCLDDSVLTIHTTKRSADGTPTSASDFSFAIVSDGTVHALRSQPEIGACLCSTHNIDSERRFRLKLLHLTKGYVLDYKRKPFRIYRYQSHPASRILLADKLPVPPTITSKLTRDFIVKTEQGLYTRDDNGDDNVVSKIVDRETQVDIKLDRPGLLTMVRRDFKSLYAAYTRVNNSGAEVTIYDESHTKLDKLKLKATFSFATEFDANYAQWYLFEIKMLHRNVVFVTLTSENVPKSRQQRESWERSFKNKWAVFLINFNGSTSKRDRVPPKGNLLAASETPELPPCPFSTPATQNKFTLHVFDTFIRDFTKHFWLEVSSSGEYKLTTAKESLVLIAVDQDEGVTFFTDNHGPLDGLFMAGTYGSSDKVTNVLAVDSSGQITGSSIVLSGADPFKTAIWIFDSNGAEFREYCARDVPPEMQAHWSRHEQLIKSQQQKEPSFRSVELSPDFQRKYFSEVSKNNDFRPLPELPALICRGIGSGLDAEAYIKTPDNGIYAVFRIQNKRLHDSLVKLEKIILERCVGPWLTDEFRNDWVTQCQKSTMIAGNAFGAYWQLSEDRQEELCSAAGVDSELIKKLRPP